MKIILTVKLHLTKPAVYSVSQKKWVSGCSGWSIKHDRFGSIYTTIYVHDIYSDAHTVDTSIYTAKLIDLSTTSIHVDSTAVKHSAYCSVDQPGCPSADNHVTPESISRPYKERFCRQSSDVHVTSRLSDATKRDTRISLAVLYGQCFSFSTMRLA